MIELDSVASQDELPTIAAPALADETARPDRGEAERLELLLQGQQDVLDVIRRDGDLSAVLARLAEILDSAFAPGRCRIVLHSSEDSRLLCEAAPHVPVDCRVTDHDAADAGTGELRVYKISAERDGEADTVPAIEHGFQLCWVQPIAECGISTCATIEIYAGREPDAADRRILRSAIPLVRFAVASAQQAAALRATSERLSSLASTIPGVIYQRIVHPDGQIRYSYISDGARDLFGVSAEEILADPDALFRRHSPEY